MRNRSWRELFTSRTVILRNALLASLLVTGGMMLWRQVGTGLESLEINGRDRLMRLSRTDQPDPRLLVVGVTEPDIQQYGQPLSDATVAQLLTTLYAAQPRAIGLDIIRDIPQQEGRSQLLQVLQQQPQTVVVCKVGTAIDPGYPPPPEVPKSRVGFSNLPADPGGAIRRGLIAVVPPELPEAASDNPCQDPTEPAFSLGFQVVRQYLDDLGMPLTLTPNQEIQLGETLIPPLTPTSGGYQHADTGGYQILLQYPNGATGIQQISLTEVLNQSVDPALIRDRIVLIGYVAESAKDTFQTPFNTGARNNLPMPGVVIHAQLSSQLLGTVLDGNPLPWFMPQWAEILWIWIWALAGGLLAAATRRPLIIGTTVLSAIALGFGLAYLAFLRGGWVLVASPILALAINLMVVSLLDRYAQSISRQIKGLLKLDIEIDEAETQSTVQEIAETEYFQEIQKAGERIKQRRQKQPSDSPPSQPQSAAAPTATSADPAPETSPIPEDLETPTSTSQLSPNHEIETDDSTSLNDYFQDIKAQGQRMRNNPPKRHPAHPLDDESKSPESE